MIKKGDTIIYKADESNIFFYWLCDIRNGEYIFFDWFANPRKATLADYWRVSKQWFDTKEKEGAIEIYDSLPLDKYGVEFEAQAIKRNN